MPRITVTTNPVGKKRPDWIACVVTSDLGESHKLYGKTWCGETPAGFTFQSVDHAALNGFNEDRLVCCPDCLREIVTALGNGHTIERR